MSSFLASLALAVSMLTTASTSTSTTAWSNSYAAALAATKSRSKPLLIILDRPSDASNRVEQVSYTDDSLQASLLRPYELCHVDVSSEYGQAVAKAFRVESFPYTAIIDKTGSTLIFQKTGQFTTENWAATLVNYKAGVYVNPKDCLT